MGFLFRHREQRQHRQVWREKLMMKGVPSLFLLLSALLFLTCSGRGVDYSSLSEGKRSYSDPDDPRNLFANMYGGVFKRGLGDEDDPRNLFKAMYGANYKRSPADDPRNLFKSVYGGLYRRK